MTRIIIIITALLFTSMNLFPIPNELENRDLTWTVQVSGSDASFRGVCAVSPKIAWASGSKSTIVRTINSGKSWTTHRVQGMDTLDFRDIQAFDGDNAIVISADSPAKIFKTINGGKSWMETYSNSEPGIFFDSMAFWNRNEGIAFSDPVAGAFFVITTKDGGNSWQRIAPGKLPTPLKGEAGFAASGTCLTVQGNANVWFCTGGGAARVIYSNDKGFSWDTANTPIISGKPSRGAFSIIFKDEMQGVVVGGNYKEEKEINKNAAITSDGGKTWKLVEQAPPSGFRECVVYIPALGKDVMITVGPSGCDISYNNGKNWRQFSTKGFHSISVAPGSTTAWAVGANGSIARLN
jgi:photosystem II stability/assembly factor-like uncharacterized protein